MTEFETKLILLLILIFILLVGILITIVFTKFDIQEHCYYTDKGLMKIHHEIERKCENDVKIKCNPCATDIKNQHIDCPVRHECMYYHFSGINNG